MRISEKTVEDIERGKEAEKEQLIREKLREMALKELEKDGKL